MAAGEVDKSKPSAGAETEQNADKASKDNKANNNSSKRAEETKQSSNKGNQGRCKTPGGESGRHSSRSNHGNGGTKCGNDKRTKPGSAGGQGTSGEKDNLQSRYEDSTAKHIARIRSAKYPEKRLKPRPATAFPKTSEPKAEPESKPESKKARRCNSAPPSGRSPRVNSARGTGK